MHGASTVSSERILLTLPFAALLPLPVSAWPARIPTGTWPCEQAFDEVNRSPDLSEVMNHPTRGRHDYHAMDALYLRASIVEKASTASASTRPLGRHPGLHHDRRGGVLYHRLLCRHALVYGTRDITDAADAAVALVPLVGRFASVLFAVGLLNAALRSAAILPLATAYNIAEGLGFESGVNKTFSEAPAFYWLYTLLIVMGAGFVLIPRLPLIRLIMISQGLNQDFFFRSSCFPC